MTNTLSTGVSAPPGRSPRALHLGALAPLLAARHGGSSTDVPA